MAFTDFELSQASGQPIELYEFNLGGTTFAYTTGEAVLVSGLTFIPAEISRSALSFGPEIRQDVVQVTMPRALPPADQFVGIVPGQQLTLTIRRLHRNDANPIVPETVVIFKGIVRTVGYAVDGGRATLVVAPLTEGLSAEAPRFTFQGLCNHVLYDSRCKVVEEDFSATDNISGADGSSVIVPIASNEVDGFYNGGFARLANGDFRLILRHIGNTLDLLLPFAGNVVGSEVTIFAGCDHTLPTCKDKFNNVVNYGGFAFVPLRNLFEVGID